MATCDDSHIYLAPEIESHVFRTADSLRLLRGISSRDAEMRKQALDVIARTLDGYVVMEQFVMILSRDCSSCLVSGMLRKVVPTTLYYVNL